MVGEVVQRFDELAFLLTGTLEAKGEQCAGAFLKVTVCQIFVLTAFCVRIVDKFHFRTGLQEFHYLAYRLQFLIQTNSQCLQALQYQVGFKGSQCTAEEFRKEDLEQCDHRSTRNEFHTASRIILQISHLPGLLIELRETLLRIREVTFLYHQTGDHIAVSVQFLGCGIYRDVRAVFKRLVQIRGSYGIVYHHRYTMFVSDGCDGIDIIQLDPRIADGFQIDCLGILIDQFLISCGIIAVFRESGLHTVLRQKLDQIQLCRAVQGRSCYDVAAALSEKEQCVGDGCHSGRKRYCCFAAFQFRDPCFQNTTGRGSYSGVDAARFCAGPESSGAVDIFQIKGSGLINGRCHGMKMFCGIVSCSDRVCAETIIICHCFILQYLLLSEFDLLSLYLF